jgi:hypothetical protein
MIHYRVHNISPLVPILSQINPVLITSFCLSKIHFNIVTCWLVTRQIICGLWILCSVYWIYRQAEFTITYYSLNLTVNTLR